MYGHKCGYKKKALTLSVLLSLFFFAFLVFSFYLSICVLPWDQASNKGKMNKRKYIFLCCCWKRLFDMRKCLFMKS